MRFESVQFFEALPMRAPTPPRATRMPHRDRLVREPERQGDCRKIGGAPASWVPLRLFSDRGWMRGLDFEVGENRG